MVVEIRKLFGTSFKGYENYSLKEIDFFKSEPHKTNIDLVYGDQIIQKILTTSNTFTIHLGKNAEGPLSVKEICDSNLESLLVRLWEPIDAFAKHQKHLN